MAKAKNPAEEEVTQDPAEDTIANESEKAAEEAHVGEDTVAEHPEDGEENPIIAAAGRRDGNGALII